MAQLSNGETISYQASGDGDRVLVLVHGQLSSSRHFKPLIPLLCEEYQVYTIDMRGFGGSSYVTPVESLHELADDLAEFSRIMGINKAVYAGWSTGGCVVMSLAANYPELVDKLILITSASYKGYALQKSDEHFMPIAGTRVETKEEMGTFPALTYPASHALKTKDYALMKERIDIAMHHITTPTPEDEKELLDAVFQQRNYLDVQWALNMFDISDEPTGNGNIHDIKAPVLSLWGEDDVLISRYMAEETVAALGDKAKFVVFTKCGHNMMMDRTEAMVKEMDQFMKL